MHQDWEVPGLPTQPQWPQAQENDQWGKPAPAHQGWYPSQPDNTVPVSGVTTITGGVIQLVQAVAWMVIAVVLLNLSRDAVLVDPEDFDGAATAEDIRSALILLSVIFLMIAAAMVVLAVFVLLGFNGVRLTSAIMQTIFGAFSMLSLLGSLTDLDLASLVPPLLNTAACAVSATLLYLNSSARYCQQRRGRKQPGYAAFPAYPGYPSHPGHQGAPEFPNGPERPGQSDDPNQPGPPI